MENIQLDGIDELIRDITKVGFMPKSEARRRIQAMIAAAEERGYQRRAEEETNMKVYPLGHVLEEEQRIANAVAAAEERMVERVIDYLEPQAPHICQELRARFLTPS